MTQVRWSDRALSSLQAITRELDSFTSQTAATRQAESIWHAIAQLAQFPLSGRMHTSSPTRRQLAVASTPYIVFYRYRSGPVEILDLRHGARRPLKRFPR